MHLGMVPCLQIYEQYKLEWVGYLEKLKENIKVGGAGRWGRPEKSWDVEWGCVNTITILARNSPRINKIFLNGG